MGTDFRNSLGDTAAVITIIDYNMGNLASIVGAFKSLGISCRVSSSPKDIVTSDRIILPGVGSFKKAMDVIKERGIDEALNTLTNIHERPLLGICLGMQILASRGEEGGGAQGLGLIEGEVRRFNLEDKSLKIPHVGFNEVVASKKCKMFESLSDSPDFYFVHSYFMACANREDVSGVTTYGSTFDTAVEKGNIWGCQFHPEKSQKNGLMILENFSRF